MKRETLRRWAGAIALGLALSVAPPADASQHVVVDMWIDCDNHDEATGEHEPIITMWSGDYTVGDTETAVWLIVEYPIGTTLGVVEPASLTTKRRHDSWLSGDYPVPNGEFQAELFIDGDVVAWARRDCTVQPTAEPVVDPVPYAPERIHTERIVVPVAPIQSRFLPFPI